MTFGQQKRWTKVEVDKLYKLYAAGVGLGHLHEHFGGTRSSDACSMKVQRHRLNELNEEAPASYAPRQRRTTDQIRARTAAQRTLTNATAVGSKEASTAEAQNPKDKLIEAIDPTNTRAEVGRDDSGDRGDVEASEDDKNKQRDDTNDDDDMNDFVAYGNKTNDIEEDEHDDSPAPSQGSSILENTVPMKREGALVAVQGPTPDQSLSQNDELEVIAPLPTRPETWIEKAYRTRGQSVREEREREQQARERRSHR